ncbi:hypothetical protein [Arthrobacter sp. 260]|uniref:hypothetical protein n=1 Tax=Arthrobacter sp. 260 TaxID=2735314 RepID=UPI00149321D9|nr:hypothetical protein [Arthrobacter sp. 260]NOJ61023.1 hypothetical protein [Arthrobacter sp. 260]
MSALSDLLNDSNTEKLSARRIQAIAESKGVKVTNTSIPSTCVESRRRPVSIC